MPRPGRQRLQQVAPFAAAAYLPLLFVALPGVAWDAGLLAAGMAATTALVVAGVLLPWQRLPRWPVLVAGFSYLAIIALLREAGGGNSSGLGPMILLPVIWFALYGSRTEVSAIVAGSALVYWLPIALDGTGVRYPESGWRIGGVFLITSAILAFTVQRLHARERRQRLLLAGLAYSDELTGLPNRRAWDVALPHALADAERAGQPLSVALIDLDGFKDINDTDGHAEGDDVLTASAAGWAKGLRERDLLARIGGDEFAVLLPGADARQAAAAMDRWRAATHRTTCSAGVAEWDGREDAAALVRRADRALYDAKRAGRDQVLTAAS